MAFNGWLLMAFNGWLLIPQTVFTLRGSDGVAFRRGYGSFADPSAAAGGQISL